MHQNATPKNISQNDKVKLKAFNILLELDVESQRVPGFLEINLFKQIKQCQENTFNIPTKKNNEHPFYQR